MEFLPNEIVVSILFKVPIIELGSLKCVCKSWRRIIIDNQAEVIQLHRGSPTKSRWMNNPLLIMRDDRDPGHLFCTYLADCKTGDFRQKVLISRNVVGNYGFGIVGSCNGMLCLMKRMSWVVVMNPITNQSMCLPSLDLIYQPGEFVLFFGFGYNLNTNSYKVVVILAARYCFDFAAVVFDCKTSNNWRRVAVGKKPRCFWRTHRELNPGILLNGRLHWITEQGFVTFDLIDDKFKSIEMPRNLDGEFCDLILFKGCLCIVKQFQCHITVNLQIWVMKQYGIDTSWEPLVRYSPPFTTTCFKALGEVENGKILIKRCITMLLYDPISSEVTSLDQYDLLPAGSSSIIHFPTLDWPFSSVPSG